MEEVKHCSDALTEGDRKENGVGLLHVWLPGALPLARGLSRESGALLSGVHWLSLSGSENWPLMADTFPVK